MNSVQRPSASDRFALGLCIVIGAGVTVWTVVQAVLRVIQVLPNRDVPVLASFADTTVALPLGGGAGTIEAGAQQLIVSASDMAPITVVSLVLAEVTRALAVALTVVCVSTVLRNLMRGRAFERTNVRFVGTATIAVAVGWSAHWLFSTMGANGAVAALGGEVENTPIPLDPLMAFAIASLGGLTVAFQAGHRLERETEGLV